MGEILDESFFASVAKDENLNVAEKGGMLLLGGIIKGFVEPVMTGMKVIKDKTGFDIEKKMIELQEQEDEEKKRHPWRWAAKKVAIGTIKGLLGTNIPNNS